MLLLASGTAGVVAAGNGPSDATATEAQHSQERALDLWEELQALDATDEVDVQPSVKRSIRNHLQQGNLSQQNARYGDAIDHYRTAQNQTKAALVRLYNERTALLLNATSTHLAGLEREGYTTPEIDRKQTKVKAYRDRLRSADSPTAARRLEADTVALHRSLSELPEPAVVQWVRWFGDGLVALPAIVLVAVGVGAGIVVGRRRERSDWEEKLREANETGAPMTGGSLGQQDQGQRRRSRTDD